MRNFKLCESCISGQKNTAGKQCSGCIDNNKYERYIKTAKIFLSHAMSGLTEAEVIVIRQEAEKEIQVINEKHHLWDRYEIIDNYHHDEIPQDAGRLVHLGRSIQQLDGIDYMYICKESNSNGCLVEKYIAAIYEIPILNFVEHPLWQSTIKRTIEFIDNRAFNIDGGGYPMECDFNHAYDENFNLVDKEGVKNDGE